MTLTLRTINDADAAHALELLAPLVENSPAIVDQAFQKRPFATTTAVESAILGALYALSVEEQLALFRRHPALAGTEAREGRMTLASTSEQGRLGLDRLDAVTLARLDALNAAYETRFGHPFILALFRVPTLEEVFEIFERRLASPTRDERRETLDQIAAVIRSRIDRAFAPTDHDQHAAAAAAQA